MNLGHIKLGVAQQRWMNKIADFLKPSASFSRSLQAHIKLENESIFWERWIVLSMTRPPRIANFLLYGIEWHLFHQTENKTPT